MMKILSAEFFERIAHRVAISPALRTLEKTLDISHNLRVAIARCRLENFKKFLHELRKPFSTLL
jgi:hypothetical protein